jgi:hypothetical protein
MLIREKREKIHLCFEWNSHGVHNVRNILSQTQSVQAVYVEIRIYAHLPVKGDRQEPQALVSIATTKDLRNDNIVGS